MQQQSRRPAPLALTNSDIVPLSRSRTASSAISQPAISVQQRPPNPPSPTQSTTSFTRRMSWLFTSPWSDSQSTTTLQSQSDNMLQAPLNHLRRGINPTTVSAPGRSAQIEQGRRRGSSISSACSVVSSVSLASTAVNGTVKPPTSSNSNSPQQIVSNSKNPEEYAIHVLFLEFAKASDSKLAWARNFKLSDDPDLTSQLRSGADPNFDRLLHTMGSLARQRPKAVVDALMIWRKSKIDQTPDVATLRSAARGEPISKEILGLVRERNSLVSIFILCRALIEVVKQLKPDALADDLGVKLEEMVFKQLKDSDPILIARSSNRTAIMSLFSELIGWLSNVRFASVSDRFIAELEKLPIIAEITDSKENKRTEMVIRAMRFLKLKIYPEAALEETSEFLLSLAKFFSRVKSIKAKHAYSDLFIELLLPLASITVAEVNYPGWAQCVETLYPKGMKMAMKPKHWLVSFPLVTTLLCVSRREFFLEKFLSFVELSFQKLKEKYMRQLVLGCTTRLLWVYLYRCPESFMTTEKKLDMFLKLVFPPGRKQVYPVDTPLEHFVRIVHIIVMKDIDHNVKTLVLPLLGVEAGTGIITGATVESLAPERYVIALKAVMLVLRDLEAGLTKPAFPLPGEIIGLGGAILMETMEFPASELPETLQKRKSVQNLIEKIGETLTRVFSILDITFGQQTLLDDKYLSHRNMYSISNVVVTAAKELASDSMVTSYSHFATLSVTYSRDKQPFFDLLRTCIDIVPRIMPAEISIAKMAEMLSWYVVHIDQDLAKSAADAMRRLALQKNAAHIVVSAMNRLMDRLSDRYSELLYAAFVEEDKATGKSKKTGLLKLYVNLLETWSTQLDEAAVEKTSEFDEAAMWNLIDETEANGLFLLCGHSPAIRRCAAMVLKLAAEIERKFDQGARKVPKNQDQPTPHISDILEGSGEEFIEWCREYLERTQLYGKMEDFVRLDEDHAFWCSQARLKQLAESENPLHFQLWNNLFPALVSLCMDRFPITVALTKNASCNRLVQMHPLILWSSEQASKVTSSTHGTIKRSSVVSKDFIEQWAVYLKFACTTITIGVDGMNFNEVQALSKKRSKSVGSLNPSINTARDLFNLVMPFLNCDHDHIRNSVVDALGKVNANVYQFLIDELKPFTRLVIDEPRARRTIGSSQSSSRRSRKYDRLRTDLTSIYKASSRFLRLKEYSDKEEIVSSLIRWIKEMKSFLSETDVKVDLEHNHLREEFSGLVGAVYEGICTKNCAMDYNLRISCWKLLEEWCGYGDTFEPKTLPAPPTIPGQPNEISMKWNLELSALQAMSSLCKGPLIPLKPTESFLTFNINTLLQWIDYICESPDKYVHQIAKNALEAIIEYNCHDVMVVESYIQKSYSGDPTSPSTIGYFFTLSEFIIQNSEFPCEPPTILGLILFKAGDPTLNVRKQALRLLKTVEERLIGFTCAGEVEIALCSELGTVYKQAQARLSTRLAQTHPSLTYQLSSEMMMRMENLSLHSQRDMLVYSFPWLHNIVLSMDNEVPDEVSYQSHIILNNLFYLTIRYGNIFSKEVEQLWAETNKDNCTYNAKVIVTFLLNMGMEKRNPNFITHAKSIIVYLGRTEAYTGMIEALMAEITPRSLVPEVREDKRPYERLAPDMFIANLDAVLVSFPKRQALCRGQLALIFLTDYAVEAGLCLQPHFPLILHNLVIQLESSTSVFFDQLYMFLTNLIFSIFITKPISAQTCEQAKSLIEFLDANESKLKKYAQKKNEENIMEQLIVSITNLFAHADEEIVQKWGETSLNWATQCPVRNAASSSFRVFRTLAPVFNQAMMAEILARLSNTISDSSAEIQDFAMEILTTLRILVEPLEEGHILHFPEVFWGSIAVLYTKNKNEYTLGLQILESVLSKLDIDEPTTQEILTATFPSEWNNEFEGIQPLLLKGLKSVETEPQCLRLINSLMQTDGGALIDPSDGRGMFLILANLPRLIVAMDEPFLSEDVLLVAGQIYEFADHYELHNMKRIFESFGKRRFRSKDDFLKQIALCLKELFFPEYEWDALAFLTGLLSNVGGWFKSAVFKILKTIIPFVNLQKVEHLCKNTELIVAPLLRHLATEFGDEALEVLEATMIAPSQPPKSDQNTTPRRMMNKSAHRTTPSTDSGWFVGGDVDKATAQARQNVHSVLLSCSMSMGKPLQTAPILEFTVFENDVFSDFTSPSTLYAGMGVGYHSRAWSQGEDNNFSAFTSNAREYAREDASERGHVRQASSDTGETSKPEAPEDSSDEDLLQAVSKLNDLDAFFAEDGIMDEDDDSEEEVVLVPVANNKI